MPNAGWQNEKTLETHPMVEPIYFFTKNDPYYELSNFSPYGFEDEGVYWPTVEHYFQAQKFNDAVHQERIRLAYSPKQAKSLGQSRAIPIRSDWESVKEDVMRHALLKKFAHPKMKTLLLGTQKRELIEKSPFDTYWGSGQYGTGKNRLGLLLMEVRDLLRAL